MGAKHPQFCRLQRCRSSLRQRSQTHPPVKMAAASLQPHARRSRASQLEEKLGWAGQIRPNWRCSDECTARSREDKDTAGIPGRSARPLVGQAEEVRLLAVRDVIHVLWKTNALSVFPRPCCLPDGSLLNKETLSMETWAGGILWKPPSQMQSQASQHQPDEPDPHLPWQVAEDRRAGSPPSYRTLRQGPASCP